MPEGACVFMKQVDWGKKNPQTLFFPVFTHNINLLSKIKLATNACSIICLVQITTIILFQEIKVQLYIQVNLNSFNSVAMEKV